MNKYKWALIVVHVFLSICIIGNTKLVCTEENICSLTTSDIYF